MSREGTVRIYEPCLFYAQIAKVRLKICSQVGLHAKANLSGQNKEQMAFGIGDARMEIRSEVMLEDMTYFCKTWTKKK